MSEAGRVRVHRLARLGLTTADAAALAAFFEAAFGFRRVASERCSGAAFASLMGVEGGAESIRLGLGSEIIELLQFDRRGRSYPPGQPGVRISFPALRDHGGRRTSMDLRENV